MKYSIRYALSVTSNFTGTVAFQYMHRSYAMYMYIAYSIDYVKVQMSINVSYQNVQKNYASAVLAFALCSSARHKPVFYRSGYTDRVIFLERRFLSIYHIQLII